MLRFEPQRGVWVCSEPHCDSDANHNYGYQYWDNGNLDHHGLYHKLGGTLRYHRISRFRRRRPHYYTCVLDLLINFEHKQLEHTEHFQFVNLQLAAVHRNLYGECGLFGNDDDYPSFHLLHDQRDDYHWDDVH